MVSEKQIVCELVGIYENYLSDREDKENRENAYDVYTRYFNGADILFSKNVSFAIWKSFNLYEGSLGVDEAKKILEELRKTEIP